MVRTIGVLLVVICSSVPVKASPLKHWGFQVGYASATQEWEHPLITDDEIVRRSGFYAGAFTEWLGNGYLTLHVGLNYETKGTGHKIMATDAQGRDLGEVTKYSRLDYLSIPVFLKATLHQRNWAVYGLGGPRIDFLVGYAKGPFDLEDEYKTTVFGVSGGFGFEIPVASVRRLFAEFVYNHDLSWLHEFQLVDGTTARLKNRSFTISVGVRL
jgi:hypothetical protein